MIVMLTIIHVFVVCLMMLVILMQSGRGGGLTQGFASAETMFGAKTNEFMVKTTSVLLGIFILTSLLLAHLSARKDQSLMSRVQKPVQTVADSQAPAATTQEEMVIPQPATSTTQQIPETAATTAQQDAVTEPAATTPEPAPQTP